MEKGTVSMHFVEAAVAGLRGEERLAALRSAAIPSELVGVPHARVPAAFFSVLWLVVVR